MLVNLNAVLAYAEKNQCAIGSFNTPNLETIQAVIHEAEARNVPVIIMHAQVHESVSPLAEIGPIMVFCAKNSSVPVCVHLDHGEDLVYLEQALKFGFTSVMFDGSLLPYEENVKNTIAAVQLAKPYQANVEAEIGVLGGRESGDQRCALKDSSKLYTDPVVAAEFVNKTNIDALACSFGTAHGLYKVAPKLDFNRIEKIANLTKIPLVMHGGSGVLPEDYRKAISLGIRKINYYSYMAKAGLDGARSAIQNPAIIFYHDLVKEAYQAMRRDIAKAMDVFYARQN